MKYDRIIISGCKRFSVSGRYYIDIRPTAKVQMILGTNGGGKSTLAQLGFSPLPINPKHMNVDGYFIKEGTFKGDHYRLEGYYPGKNKQHYTFIKNGEMLLDKGNRTTYLDLIDVHLDYTPWLHDLLTGRVQFTHLGPAQRQDLLSKMSKSDFTQAFKMLSEYKKEFTKHNEVAKYLTKRINEQKAKLINKDEYEHLKKQKIKLSKDYEDISKIDLEPLDNSLPSYITAKETVTATISKHLTSTPKGAVKPNMEALLAYIENLKEKQIEIRTQVNSNNELLINKQQELGAITGGLEDLISKTEELLRLEEQLKQLPEVDTDIPKDYFKQGIDDILDSLMVMVGDLPIEMPEEHKLLSMQRSLSSKQMELSRYKDKLQRIEDELKHIADIDLVNCPECNFEFKPGVSLERLNKLNENKGKGLNLIQELDKTIQEDQLDYNHQQSERDKLTTLVNYKNRNLTRAAGFFRYIDSIGGFSLGRELVTILTNFKHANYLYFQRLAIEEGIQRLKKILDHSNGLDTKQKELKLDIKELTDRLNILNKHREENYEQFQKANDYKKWIDDEDKSLEGINNELEILAKVTRNEVNSKLRNIKQEMMNETLSQMASIDSLLNEQNVVISFIKDFEERLEDAQIQADIYKTIVNEMSPRTGLIAEQIILSIGSILKGLNQLFEKIWGYPLTVGMSKVGDNGLDYKFPLSDSSFTRDDVSEGSDSMIEMVNRAIVLMAYYSMDLNDYPLFLDEPGRAFDKVHQLNLIPLIRDLSASVRYSQIVLISHSEDIQTSLPNSEVIIIDDRNIQYPHPYNLHVSFENPNE